jgi:hypothetical protein
MVMVFAKTILGWDFVQEMVGTGWDAQALPFTSVLDSVSLFRVGACGHYAMKSPRLLCIFPRSGAA